MSLRHIEMAAPWLPDPPHFSKTYVKNFIKSQGDDNFVVLGLRKPGGSKLPPPEEPSYCTARFNFNMCAIAVIVSL